MPTCAPLVQRGIRYLRALHLSSHRERKLLLQQQKDIVSVQRSAALLQQELQDRTRLPQVGILTLPGGLAHGQKRWPLPGHVQVLCKTPVIQGGKGFRRVGREGQQLLRGPRGLSWPGLPGWAQRRNQTPRGWKVLWPGRGELSEQGWGSVEGAGGAEVGARQEGGRGPGPLRGRPLGS